MKDYTSGTPIKSEAVLRFSEIPSRQSKRNFQITESLIQREDNLFMTIEEVTEEEAMTF